MPSIFRKNDHFVNFSEYFLNILNQSVFKKKEQVGGGNTLFIRQYFLGGCVVFESNNEF